MLELGFREHRNALSSSSYHTSPSSKNSNRLRRNIRLMRGDIPVKLICLPWAASRLRTIKNKPKNLGSTLVVFETSMVIGLPVLNAVLKGPTARSTFEKTAAPDRCSVVMAGPSCTSTSKSTGAPLLQFIPTIRGNTLAISSQSKAIPSFQ